MNCAAIIAVKSTSAAKSRLREALSTRQHDSLVDAMLRHVVRAAREACAISEVFLVSPEQRAGDDWPRTLLDSAEDLNTAFELGLRTAFREGYGAALLLPADLARVTAADLDEFIRRGAAAGAALAPDRAGTGTNAVYLRRARPLSLSFGPGSCARHRAACQRLGITPAVAEWPTLSLDIDGPADLGHLRGIEEYEFLWSSERSVA